MPSRHTDVPGIEITITEHGNLKLTADAQGAGWLREQQVDRTDVDVLSSILETHSCNGSFTVFEAGRANPAVGLTDAPCIAEAMSIDEYGKRQIEGRFWYFNDYATRDMVETLIKRGDILFHLGPDQSLEIEDQPPSPTRGPRP